MSYTVYKILNNETVVYVGQTKQFKTRINQHFNTKPMEGQYGFGKFYGLRDSHSVEIIAEVETKQEARKLEDQWQSYYGIIPESIRKTNGIMRYKARGGVVSQHQTIGAKKMNSMKIRCELCGFISNPGAIAGSHRNSKNCKIKQKEKTT